MLTFNFWVEKTFPTNIKMCAESVMSHLGYLQKVARANSPLLYTATWPTFRRLLLQVQEKFRAV